MEYEIHRMQFLIGDLICCSILNDFVQKAPTLEEKKAQKELQVREFGHRLTGVIACNDFCMLLVCVHVCVCVCVCSCVRA